MAPFLHGLFEHSFISVWKIRINQKLLTGVNCHTSLFEMILNDNFALLQQHEQGGIFQQWNASKFTWFATASCISAFTITTMTSLKINACSPVFTWIVTALINICKIKSQDKRKIWGGYSSKLHTFSPPCKAKKNSLLDFNKFWLFYLSRNPGERSNSLRFNSP